MFEYLCIVFDCFVFWIGCVVIDFGDLGVGDGIGVYCVGFECDLEFVVVELFVV